MGEQDHPWLRWLIKEGGSGEVVIKEVTGDEVSMKTIVFGSLNQLPENIQNAIRSDGRTQGTIP